jgi:opacity protein-like surface antigen
MNALRKYAVSLAIALASAPVAAQENPALDGGWNKQYGMVFNLQNVFTQAGILGGYGGGIGVQYNLAPESALRIGIDVSRTSNPTYEQTTTPTGGTPDTNLVVPAGYLSSVGVGVSGSYLKRLGSSALAPYLGAGVSLGFTNDSRSYEDDITTAGVVTMENDYRRTFEVGLLGQLGLEWRVHKSLSVFAEYGLSVSALEMSSGQDQSRTTSGGTIVTDTRSEFSRTKFFDVNTGLVQGGSLGLVAFF